MKGGPQMAQIHADNGKGNSRESAKTRKNRTSL